MKALIGIEFKKINKVEVTEELLEKEPRLKGLTEDTLNELCVKLEEYFKEKKIEVIAKYNIEKWS